MVHFREVAWMDNESNVSSIVEVSIEWFSGLKIHFANIKAVDTEGVSAAFALKFKTSLKYLKTNFEVSHVSFT